MKFWYGKRSKTIILFKADWLNDWKYINIHIARIFDLQKNAESASKSAYISILFRLLTPLFDFY
jgi:hypothetical protein